MGENYSKVRRAQRRLTQALGRDPSTQELAQEVGLIASKVQHALEMTKQPASLDAPIGEHGDASFGDLIEDRNAVNPFDAVTQTRLTEATRRGLATLTPREERVMRMRLGIGLPSDHTLEEIGKELKVTRERVRQFEAKVLGKLQHVSRARRLRAFLEEQIRNRAQRRRRRSGPTFHPGHTQVQLHRAAREGSIRNLILGDHLRGSGSISSEGPRSDIDLRPRRASSPDMEACAVYSSTTAIRRTRSAIPVTIS